MLAERLDIRDEADADHVHLMQDWSQAEDVESYLALVYNFTTWLQESLVQAMPQSLDARPERAVPLRPADRCACDTSDMSRTPQCDGRSAGRSPILE